MISLALGAGMLCALGVGATTIIPNADAAPAVTNGIYFPIVFISGVFYPLAQRLGAGRGSPTGSRSST